MTVQMHPLDAHTHSNLVMATIDRMSGGLLGLLFAGGEDVAQLVGAKLWHRVAPGVDRLHRQTERLGEFSHAAEQLDGVLCFHGSALNHVLQTDCKHVFK